MNSLDRRIRQNGTLDQHRVAEEDLTGVMSGRRVHNFDLEVELALGGLRLWIGTPGQLHARPSGSFW
jgi:hypothetical protein